jgi:hypothetical protein
MVMYTDDYDDDMPVAGGEGARWVGRLPDWKASDRRAAYGLAEDGTGGEVSISASLYLLVRYGRARPEAFLCSGPKGKGEKGTSVFRPERYAVRGRDLAELWDFGPNPARHCSYAYNMPYTAHKVTSSRPPGFAVAADRNPWMDAPSRKAGVFSSFVPDRSPLNGRVDQARAGNAASHHGDGQNVLFQDLHVSFVKRAYCGHEDDNIYTSWDGEDRIRGVPPRLGSVPAHEKDSLLVNDPPTGRD